jgi:hypothetical protein
MPGEEAHIFKARYLYGRHGRICGRHKREGGGALPGEISLICLVLLSPRGGGMDSEKSAEGIVGFSTEPKART